MRERERERVSLCDAIQTIRRQNRQKKRWAAHLRKNKKNNRKEGEMARSIEWPFSVFFFFLVSAKKDDTTSPSMARVMNNLAVFIPLSLLFLFYSSCWAFSWRRRDTHNVIHFLLLDQQSAVIVYCDRLVFFFLFLLVFFLLINSIYLLLWFFFFFFPTNFSLPFCFVFLTEMMTGEGENCWVCWVRPPCSLFVF